MCSTTTSPSDLGLTDKNHACSCGTENHSDDASRRAAEFFTGDEMIREHFAVQGMTCSHCVASVTEEVLAIAGVDSVSVGLNVGGLSKIMVVSLQPIARDDVRDAVTEAGYKLVAD